MDVKRKTLAVGNEYYTGPSKSRRFRVQVVSFRGRNPGIGVRWLTSGSGNAAYQFLLFDSEEKFWSCPLFQKAVDAEVSK